MTQASIATSQILRAARIACNAHDGQRRKGSESPYIIHPLRVAESIAALPDDTPGDRHVMILAALLHDVLEDTDVPATRIEEAFGPVVLSVVRELTQDMALAKPERKRLMLDHLQDLSVEARTVKLADRLDNLRDLDTMSEEFVARYVPESRILLERLRGTNAALEAKVSEILDRYPKTT